MPIKTVHQLIHLRSKTNKQVMNNVARLWEICRHAQSAQDILDGLHPWGKYNSLEFHNRFSYVFIMIGMLSLVLGWLMSHYFPIAFTLLMSVAWFFIAYISYESDDPIEEVIQALELKMKMLKDDLQFQKLPAHLTGVMNSNLVLGKLKQSFPLFNQGSESNEIERFASTTWIDQNQQSHPVLLFKYHYVSYLSLSNADGEEQKLKKTENDLWGAFVFKTKSLGIAASNKRDRFFHPYTQDWHSSDIQLNQKLNIFGYDQHQLARSISPALTLKLNDLFEDLKGDLVIHFQENILCYMVEQDLFRTMSKKSPQEIRNISELRGYLRTLDMPDYQQFKQRMLNFIE